MPLAARDIKDYGLYLGYARVGLTSADDFTEFLEILESRAADYDFHLAGPLQPRQGARPRETNPSARTVIVMALDYGRTDMPAPFVGRIGRMYPARCHYPPAGSLSRARLDLMINFLTRGGLTVSETPGLPLRWAAARAGVGSFGRNNFLYVPRLGSLVNIHSLVVDRDLEYDAPTLQSKCPPDCDACRLACPTGAIVEPFRLIPRRCLAFNAFKTLPGAGFGITSRIPREIRPLMGQRYHGCDLCQEACPRNQGQLSVLPPPDPYLRLLAEELSLENILAMPPGLFENRVRPIMYNYLPEPRFLQRNVAVAMGNTGDRACVPHLAAALENPADLVRGHAAWALGRLGGREAREALDRARTRETDPLAAEEISAALNEIR